jgi:hypothetical protein
MIKGKKIVLYTFQTIGHDITTPHNSSKDYTSESGAYWPIGQYLGWQTWIWTFPSLASFKAPFTISYVPNFQRVPTLWIIEVPLEKIKWMGFRSQMEYEWGSPGIERLFKDDLSGFLQKGDLPMGLVEAPIKKEWVVGTINKAHRLSQRKLLEVIRTLTSWTCKDKII